LLSLGSVAVNLPRTARPQGQILVVGDERVQTLAQVAGNRRGRVVAELDPSDLAKALQQNDEVVVDASCLEPVLSGRGAA